MADGTKIEWTDATWNPLRARSMPAGKAGWFCEHVSPGCKSCYAETMNRRLGTGIAFQHQNRDMIEVFLDPGILMKPLLWTRPRRIFVNSMSDTAGEFVSDVMLSAMFRVMDLASWHTFQVLTKRSKRLREFINAPGSGWGQWPLPNVWIGASVEDQRRADERVPELQATSAAIRFLSMEPLLNAVRPDLSDIDWIIVGGESGPKARPMHANWIRLIRDQCITAGVPMFFKQWGGWGLEDQDRKSIPHCIADDGTVYRMSDLAFPDGPRCGEAIRADHGKAHMHTIYRVGKKAAGAELDGREHKEFPG